MQAIDPTKLPSWVCILSWITCGISMIMFNKAILSTWGFRFPCFLTMWHCIFSTILTQILARTTDLFPAVKKGVMTKGILISRLVPMSMCFAVGLVFGNATYRYLSVSFIQMLKACTPVPLLLMYFMAGKETFSVTQLVIVVMISAGVVLASIGEMEFSFIGFVLQWIAILSDCLQKLLMDIFLKDLELDSLSLLYYNAPVSALLIGVAFFIFEWSTLSMEFFTPTFTTILFLNGFVAFALNLSVMFVVANTSAVVLSICGPIKDFIVICLSVLIFLSPVTWIQMIGFSISMFGLVCYREMKKDNVKFSENLFSFFKFIMEIITCKYKSEKEKTAEKETEMMRSALEEQEVLLSTSLSLDDKDFKENLSLSNRLSPQSKR